MSVGLVVVYDVFVLFAGLIYSELSLAGFTAFKAGTILLFGWRSARELSLIVMAELINLSPLPFLVWCLRLHSNSEHVYRKYITQLALKDLNNLVRQKSKKRRVEIYEGDHLDKVVGILISELSISKDRLSSVVQNMPSIRAIVQKRRSQFMLEVLGDDDFGKFRVNNLITPGELAMSAECLSHLLAKSITDDSKGEVMGYLPTGIKAMIDLAVSLKKYYTHDCFSLLHGLDPGDVPDNLRVFDKRLLGTIVMITRKLKSHAVPISQILDVGYQKKLDRICGLYDSYQG